MGRSDDCSSSFCSFCMLITLASASRATVTTSSERTVSDLKKHAIMRLRSSVCGVDLSSSDGIAAQSSSIETTRRRTSARWCR